MPPACDAPPRRGCERRSFGAPPAAGGRRRRGATSLGLLFTCAILLLPGCAARTSRPSDDLTTTTLVKIALLNDPRVGALRLEVTTLQGEVTVAGTVTSAADEASALAVARRVHGVRRVKSELKIADVRPPG